MRRSTSSWIAVSALVVGCGNDTGVVDTGPAPTTTSAEGSTSSSDSSSGPAADSGPETSGPPATSTTTGPVDSSSGPGVQCGDDVAEGDEACDGTDLGGHSCESQGFLGGELGCAPDCSALDTRACTAAVCGNGSAEGRELCDGDDLGGASCASEGFDSGVLGCENDCAAFDASDCGTCGNVIVDGDEACDDVALLGQTCVTQGFDYGQIACAPDCLSFETSGCGQCGDGSVGGDEDCDGADLGGSTCESLGATGGMLACNANCTFDLGGCDLAPVVYDVSAPSTSFTVGNYFRSNGYNADADGLLIDWEVYLGLAAACNLDFYVYEAPAFGGPYTQLARNTVNAGPGTGYYSAGMPSLAITGGLYYVLGVGWNCSATYYWDGSGAYAGVDGGVGLFNVSHWDNAYPGPSDLYVPPNTGGGNTVYVQRITFGQ